LNEDTYKAITTTLASLPVSDDNSLVDVAKILEVMPQRFVCRVIRQTAHKDLRVRRVLEIRHNNAEAGATLTPRR
jgi:hypothetical protein